MPPDCCDIKDVKTIKSLAKLLDVIAEENRIRIICILRGGEQCVCELWKELKLPQNLVSHHLKVLKKCKLVDSRKEGLKVIYSLNKKNLGNLMNLINKFLTT